MRCCGQGSPDDSKAARDTFARLAHRGVGHADHRVRRQTLGDVDLDGDGLTVDADEGGAADRGEHGAPPVIGVTGRAGRSDGGP